jgi:hypothetical protein
MKDNEPVPGESDPRDRSLMERLGTLAARADPVPPSVISAAKGSLAWRTIDAELAALVYDSAVDAGDLVLVRGPEAPRFLTFEAPGITVEVEVSADSGGLLFDGHLTPPRHAVVEIQHREGTLSAETDRRGRFRIDRVASGPMRMVCRPAEQPEAWVVETDWITL